jgi:CubicO group peptidase (beta-lactamase class C family)
LVLDASFQGQSSCERHILNSVTKSVLSAITGIAIERGHFSVTDPVIGLLSSRAASHADNRWSRVTVHHLLSMSSGISWPQYGPDNVSDAMGQSDDWVQFILERPMEAGPGAIVNYSNGDSHLVSAILQETTGKTAMEFAQEELFAPLDITDVVWETDPQGRSIGSAALYLRPVDVAKIGLLYLNGGKRESQQLVPAEWVAASWRNHAKMPTAGGPAGYGYYWWLYSEMGLCEAWGGAGQRIGVLGDTKTVVVVTADKPDDQPRSASISAFYSDIEKSVLGT